MFSQQGRESGYVLRVQVLIRFLPLLQSLLKIPSILQHLGVYDQPQRRQLIPHPLTIALAQFALFAVENGAGQHMAASAAVALHQHTPPVRLVLNVNHQVARLFHSTQFEQASRSMSSQW